jgi:hypothetical protein
MSRLRIDDGSRGGALIHNRSVPVASIVPVLAHADVDPASWGATSKLR